MALTWAGSHGSSSLWYKGKNPHPILHMNLWGITHLYIFCSFMRLIHPTQKLTNNVTSAAFNNVAKQSTDQLSNEAAQKTKARRFLFSTKVPTVQVCKGGLQQLGEAGSPWLSCVILLTLEVRGLLVLQFQFCKLHNQRLLPHCLLVGWATLREGSQVGDGETKDKSSVGREEGERGVYFSALCLGKKHVKHSFSIQEMLVSSFTYKYTESFTFCM